MTMKYYAVARGREGSGIYRDWANTSRNVHGVSGVKFKSFPDQAGAMEFLLAAGVDPEEIRIFGEDGESPAPSIKKAAGKTRPVLDRLRHIPADAEAADAPGAMTAYVDGSFRQGYQVYGYGVVIVKDGRAVHTLSGWGSRPEYVSMRNVAGEVMGAVKAMEYALQEGADHLILYFDYQGIESWARGTWKRNNDLTRGYHEYVRSIGDRLALTFRKVKGHSGDLFNELADELAKSAVENSETEGLTKK